MIILNDCTLRDGMHALSHQYTVEQMVAIARKLDEARVDIVEVSHGDGLNGNSFCYGFSAATEEQYLRAVRDVLTHAKLAALLLPGIGTTDDIDMAVDCGVDTIRIATHCTEADISRQHIEYGRNKGLDVVGFLMMAHMLPTAALVEQAKLMEQYGANCVYVTDSAGALLMEETRERITAMREALSCQVGFHNHHNLGLGVANSVIAAQCGAHRIDGSLAGMGAGAGNCPLEVLVAVFDRLGIEHGAKLYPLVDGADQLVRPIMRRPVQVDGNSLMLGYAGVYSSFLLHAEKAGAQFGVDPRDLLVAVGERKLIGGQEDLIADVALDLASRG